MSKKYLLRLSEISSESRDKVGGKALNLGILYNKGFLIPKGFVVTTDAYVKSLKENSLDSWLEEKLREINFEDPNSVENFAKKVREFFEKAKLPEEVVEEIKVEYYDSGFGSVAVRSSATSEDYITESFAGLMETFLNVRSFEELIECIKRCFASLWSVRSITYMFRKGISPLRVKMAVIVQEMVDARCAGVLFTIDPVSLDVSKMVVESNFGLGESVVSGEVIPDRFVVERKQNRKSISFKILSREISEKKVITIFSNQLSGSGVEHVKVLEDKGDLPSLSDREILSLAEIGVRVEKCFGYPQDIEWAIDKNGNIFVLQSRPITTLPKVEEDDIVWSRGYSDDYWNDTVSPLFFELLGDHLTNIVNIELNQIMGYSKPGDPKLDHLLKLHHARVYFNLEVLKRRVEYEIPPFLRNDDILNYFPDGSGPYGKETIKKLPFKLIRRLIGEIRVMLFDPSGSITKTAKVYDEWTKNVFRPFCSYFERKMKQISAKGKLLDYLKLAEKVDKIMIKHFRLVRYGIPVHNIGMNLLAQYLLSRFIGKKDALKLYPILISGLKHKTTETNERIERLAMLIRSSPKLKSIILKMPSDELYEYISKNNNPEFRRFAKEFNSFLKDFGVRGFTREPYYPRWYEAPQYVFDVLKPLVSEHAKQIESEVDKVKLRIKVEKEVEKRIKKQRFGKLKWKLFSTILGFARKYIIFRENQRYNLDWWITMLRRVYLEIGKIFVKNGVLKESSDIFFLTKNEIRKLVYEDLSEEEVKKLRFQIKERKEEFLKYEHVTPPKFIRGNREFNDPPKYRGFTLKGIPASPGAITAPIRVLKRIEEIPQVKTGEILVVPRTDPGWTPVFSKIGGLITETGGILSHGAVVSREYGIPAVTNVQNACKILRTGQTVTLDGSNGIIVVEKGV